MYLDFELHPRPLSHFSVATIQVYRSTLKILTEAAASVCLMVSNYGTVMNVDLRKQQQVICVHLVTVWFGKNSFEEKSSSKSRTTIISCCTSFDAGSGRTVHSNWRKKTVTTLLDTQLAFYIGPTAARQRSQHRPDSGLAHRHYIGPTSASNQTMKVH